MTQFCSLIHSLKGKSCLDTQKLLVSQTKREVIAFLQTARLNFLQLSWTTISSNNYSPPLFFKTPSTAVWQLYKASIHAVTCPLHQYFQVHISPNPSHAVTGQDLPIFMLTFQLSALSGEPINAFEPLCQAEQRTKPSCFSNRDNTKIITLYSNASLHTQNQLAYILYEISQ